MDHQQARTVVVLPILHRAWARLSNFASLITFRRETTASPGSPARHRLSRPTPTNCPHTVGPSQFQNLLFLAGYDPAYAPHTVACTASCVLPYLGKVRSINAIVLTTNGISFAVQAVLLLFIGAWADYGSWRCATFTPCIRELRLCVGPISPYSSRCSPSPSRLRGSGSRIPPNGVRESCCIFLAVIHASPLAYLCSRMRAVITFQVITHEPICANAY